MAKDRFASKGGFLLASIGAAVGLGNALRFPGQCARFGGGAYILVYFLALVLLGLPLLNAEIALGRKFRAGAPTCFGRIKRGGARLGWSACANSALTAVLYVGLAGWIITMIGCIVPLSMGGESDSAVADYFYAEILRARSDFSISHLSLPVLGALVLGWFAVFFCLRGGAKGISEAARFTVFVPVILFGLLAARGLFYENSGEALSALFTPKASELLNPQMWLSALGQVFFSTSVAVGIMPAYGSYLPEGTNVFSCSIVIAAADFFVSVLSSVVLFTTLYGCGLQSYIGETGIVTAFTVYPVAIVRLFGAYSGVNAFVGVLFYASLSMMAVQAATAMTEAFLLPFAERTGLSRKKLAAAVCAVGFALSVMLATDGAVQIVGLADRFINFYNVLALGIAECVILGTSKSLPPLAEEINRFSGRLKMPRKPFELSVKFLTPAILSALCVREIVGVVAGGITTPLWALIAFGAGLSAVALAAGLILGRRQTV